MSEYKVRPVALITKSSELYTYSNELSDIAGNVAGITSALSIEGSARAALSTRLGRLTEDIRIERISLKEMSDALKEISQLYKTADQDGQAVENGSEDTPRNGDGHGGSSVQPGVSGADGQEESSSGKEDDNPFDDGMDWLKKALGLFKEILDTDDESPINEGFGFGSSAAGYIRDLVKLWRDSIYGDEKGWEGASNILKFTKSTGSFWNSFYKYLNACSKNGLGDAWKTTSGVVGLLAGGFGFAGTLTEGFGMLQNAKNGSDRAQGYGKIIESGSDIVSIGENIYNLASTAKNKDLYTPAKFWTTTIDAWISFGGKAVSSYGKYSADGVYDFNDFLETAIDSSSTGLVKIVNSLTFGATEILGLDGDRVSGGLKNFASDWGRGAGNYVVNNEWLRNMYNSGKPGEVVSIGIGIAHQAGAKTVETISNTATWARNAIHNMFHF